MHDVIHSLKIGISCRSDTASSKIAIYDAQATNEPLHVLEKLHTKPVPVIKYNVAYEVVVSIDHAGMLEYWTGPKTDFKFPSKIVSFDSKMDTSEFKSIVTSPSNV